MADTIQPGLTRVTLTATYTLSDGSTKAADDATWTEDNAAVASFSAASGAVVDVIGIDLADGSLAVDNVTASGSGFTATAEVDVQMSVPMPTVVGIAISSSGPEAV
jgi:adenine deaminase